MSWQSSLRCWLFAPKRCFTTTVLWLVFVGAPLLATGGLGTNDAARERIKLCHVLEGNASHFVSVAFSPDGNILAAGNMDGTVRFWDVGSGKPTGKVFVHPEDFTNVFSFAFSPDGKRLASAGTGYSGSLRIWDVATGKELWKHEKFLYCNQAVFSPDGKLLAVSGYRTLYLLDPATGKEIWTAPIDPGFFSFLDFSPDGNMLLSGGHAFRHVRLWNVREKKEVLKLELPRGDVHSLVFTGNNTFTIGAHGGLHGTWSVEGKRVGEFLRDVRVQGRVLSLAVSANRELLVFGTAKGEFVVFSMKNSQRLIDGISGEANVAVAFSPDARLLATTVWYFNPPRSSLKIWDISGLEKARSASKETK